METPPHRRWTTRIVSGAWGRIFRRPIYIFWLSLLAVAFFAITFFVNRLYAQRQQQLSVEWFQKGQDALAQEKPNQAINDLRTSLLYSHDNQNYLFTLAQALAAAGRIPEAQSYFLNLLEDEPGSGSVNLELARLAAQQNDVNHALRYFNGAIYGAWDNNAVTKRQQVRQELITFLIAKDLRMQARGELLTFTAEMPRTSESELWVAEAFSRIGDDSGALQYYKQRLRGNRRDFTALKGAAESAFRLGNYREALDYLKLTVAMRSDQDTAQMLQLTSLIFDLNPFESNIPAAERRHRLILAMDIADRRLQQCSTAQHIAPDATPPNPLQALRLQWIDLDGKVQRAHSDADLMQLLAPVGALLRDIEQQNGCGAPTPDDQAMLRIYQNAEELQP